MAKDELEKTPTEELNHPAAPSHRETLSDPQAELPPVVLRMVVEVRSDGTRTIARGALEDLRLGEKVQIKIDNFSALALGREVTRAILGVPSLAKRAARTMLLPRGRRSSDAE